MELTFNELLNAINGSVIVDNPKKDFDGFCIDSRKIERNNVFVALQGEKFNGNDYVAQAIELGASIIIVDQVKFEANEKLDGVVIKVDDSKKALLSLASYYRNKLGIKVVGITGSTGKTSTKDLVAALLSGKYRVFKTMGNFNSDIGLPLMIFQLTSEYDVAVLEMGMSDLGEIHVLADTARPDIGVITNIGLSHLENLKTQDNIQKAKMEITDFFTENNLLVLNGEDERLKKITNDCYKISKTGYNDKYEVYSKDIVLGQNTVSFTAVTEGVEQRFTLPMAGKHNVLNCMLAIEVAKNLGVSFEDMLKGLKNLEATSMRLQVTKTDLITIINDCYNASPDSMKSSIDVLTSYPTGRKVAILGDMYELGTKSKESHYEVGQYAVGKLDLLVAIGENIDEYKKGFANNDIKIFPTKSDFIKEISNIIRKDDVVLVKASRGMKFEEVVNALEGIK